MPTRAPRVCGHCGLVHAPSEACPLAAARGRERKARFDRKRPTASERGYDAEWRRESKAFLAQAGNDLCSCGCGRPADMVDHKTPHRGDRWLFWDRNNWQPMNTHCHNSTKQRLERHSNEVHHV
jgi:5-methylcytosine-specific restriction endonuclease McrA